MIGYQWNVQKNEARHGVSALEAEKGSAFCREDKKDGVRV